MAWHVVMGWRWGMRETEGSRMTPSIYLKCLNRWRCHDLECRKKRFLKSLWHLCNTYLKMWQSSWNYLSHTHKEFSSWVYLDDNGSIGGDESIWDLVTVREEGQDEAFRKGEWSNKAWSGIDKEIGPNPVWSHGSHRKREFIHREERVNGVKTKERVRMAGLEDFLEVPWALTGGGRESGIYQPQHWASESETIGSFSFQVPSSS